MKKAFGWFGGKSFIVGWLLQFIPEHNTYVEVFGGSATLLFSKKPSPVEVYNDIDGDLVNFFRVIRDKDKFDEFLRKIYLTPYSREEFVFAKENLEKEKDDVERARMWYTMVNMSFSADLSSASWGFNVSSSVGGIPNAVRNYLSRISRLPEIHRRISTIQIDNDDFRKVIKRYDTENTFFYLDPPYVPTKRKSGVYRYEMSVEDHKELVDIILKVKGKVMLSGYANEIYERLEKNGWKRYDKETFCYSAVRTRSSGLLGEGALKRKQRRIESIWINYDIAKSGNMLV